MTNPTQSSCPRCGESIPENAPSGLCPACLLGGAASTTGSAGRSTSSPPPSIEDLAPHFPDLEILEMIGVGGMGAVYKVRQPRLDREVALKILHINDDDPAFEERFTREARVLARLNHPNIVNVFDFGNAGPFHFLIMEFIDGVNLRQAMQAGRFSSAEALTLVQEMCAALKSAHDEGILHRDIKPENILLDSQGRLKIADFGIAKLLGQEEAHNFTLTRQDSILGSPQYMAPEQIESPDDVDQRADIYSLGVVFYELLTGELPLGRFAAPSEKNDIDSRIDDIVFRTLAKEREARFQSAEEVSTSVATLSQPAPKKAAPAAGGKEGVARFATLAAFFTAMSIPAIGLFFYTYLSVSESPGDIASQGKVKRTVDGFYVASLLFAFLGVILPLLGIALGLGALSEIRKSGGQKRGLIRATFASLTWPFLIFLGLLIAILRAPELYTILPAPGLYTVLLVLLVGFIALGWAIVPPLCRWARNESNSLSPIFGRLLIAFGVSALAILLLVVVLKSDNSDDPPNDSQAYARDVQSKLLEGELKATQEIGPGFMRAYGLAAFAERAAQAGQAAIAEQACWAITEYTKRDATLNYESLANVTRYKCAFILAQKGFTRDAKNIAGKITTDSQKKEILYRIKTENFRDDSTPPINR